MSYSQLGQDIAVMDFYKDLSTGYFVDLGAYDGKFLSNSLLLEENGWNGICVEPLESAYENLCKIRKCYKTNKAVWRTTGSTMEFAEHETLSGFSGFSVHKNDGSDVKKIMLKTISLNDLLDEAGAPKFIEYLSIDTEGSEYDILSSVDYSKYTFGLIDVEHNYQEDNRRAIRTLLESNGYAYLRENKWDDCYIHKTLMK